MSIEYVSVERRRESSTLRCSNNPTISPMRILRIQMKLTYSIQRLYCHDYGAGQNKFPVIALSRGLLHAAHEQAFLPFRSRPRSSWIIYILHLPVRPESFDPVDALSPFLLFACLVSLLLFLDAASGFHFWPFTAHYLWHVFPTSQSFFIKFKIRLCFWLQNAAERLFHHPTDIGLLRSCFLASPGVSGFPVVYQFCVAHLHSHTRGLRSRRRSISLSWLPTAHSFLISQPKSWLRNSKISFQLRRSHLSA